MKSPKCENTKLLKNQARKFFLGNLKLVKIQNYNNTEFSKYYIVK